MKQLLFRSSLTLGLLAMGTATLMAQDAPHRGNALAEFAQMDTNGDSVITLEELQNQAQEKFRTTDTNGDGQLDVEELMAAAVRERSAIIARLMARKDTNGDGMLSAEEMIPGEGRTAHLFARADRDGNGEISQEEWNAAKADMRGHGRHAPQTPPAGN